MCKTFDFVDGTEIDLTPLTSTTRNYLAEVSDNLRSTEGPPMLVNNLVEEQHEHECIIFIFFFVVLLECL